jgi:hypothetical protein
LRPGVLQLQRRAGNRAVAAMLARVLEVTDVDYNPESQKPVHSKVDAQNLGTAIRRRRLNEGQ